MRTKYSMLLNILDQIRAEGALTKFTGLYAETDEPEQINQQRSRAFIHLFLKVRFGILEFGKREHFITDGTGDGGVDAYFPSIEERVVYFVQSKFRTTDLTFTNKQITLEELLAMDVVRILEGHMTDESGNPYSGKISQLQREVSSIDDIARYKYKIVLLANVETPSPVKLSRVVGGLPCEVIDYEESYENLVFPVISGTYFNARDLTIHLDLSNKNAGSKISYTVDTKHGECDITALFVPTLEIAKTFQRYKNSILRFNPRSYLELEGGKVNRAIRETILEAGKNEFALYNNGITMLSDETNLNERIGQRNKAQLNVRNPQIINGGQTAYTLSRIYEERSADEAEALFEGKEVLLKVITLNPGAQISENEKISLINAISVATNQQTPVITADRYSNEPEGIELQQILFDRYGLLFERKRGEFEDGLHNGYASRSQVVERNLFFRILFAANGDIKKAIEKKLFAKLAVAAWKIPSPEHLDRFYFGYLCLQRLNPDPSEFNNREIYAKLYAIVLAYIPDRVEEFESTAKKVVGPFQKEWEEFVITQMLVNDKFMRVREDPITKLPVSRFDKRRWIESREFTVQAAKHFNEFRLRGGLLAVK